MNPVGSQVCIVQLYSSPHQNRIQDLPLFFTMTAVLYRIECGQWVSESHKILPVALSVLNLKQACGFVGPISEYNHLKQESIPVIYMCTARLPTVRTSVASKYQY